jgi:hypothetical protein
VILQHSNAPFAADSFLTQVLYLLEIDRDLLELCLIAMVELLRTAPTLPDTAIAAIDSAYSALITDLNEAGVRVMLHTLILHSYTKGIRPFSGTFEAILKGEMREDETKHAFLHLQARLRVLGLALCSGFEACYDSEEPYVKLKQQYLSPPETYFQYLERLAVLKALGTGPKAALLAETVGNMLPLACTSSDLVVPFRRFEYEEGEYEEWMDFRKAIEAIQSEISGF